MMDNLMPLTVFGFAIAVVFGPVSSLFENCFGERCFTTTDSSETKNFQDAKNWCNKNASRLAVVNDNATQEALTMFLKSLQSNEQPQSSVFIDLQLKQKGRTWYLIDGTPYLGGIVNQDENQYKYYVCLQYISNKYYVSASKPNNVRNFVCKYEGTRCLNYSTNNCIDKGGCFVKYENESLNWYQARERCYKNGGDLATFNYNSGSDSYPYDVPFNTSCLNQSLSYWVGIRYRDWRWTSSDDSNEAIYTWWSTGEPSNRDYECVCVDPEVTPAWSWTDCNCNEQNQFICLKIVPTTTVTTTAITTTTTTIASTTSSATSFPSANVTDSLKTNNAALAIGLGVGLGGGVFIIILIVIIVVAVTLTRRRGRKSNGVESRNEVGHTREVKLSKIPDIVAIERPDIYAQIVQTTQHPISDSKSQSNIIYSTPEFAQDQKSEPSSYDPTDIRHGNVHSILLEGSDGLYANAVSPS